MNASSRRPAAPVRQLAAAVAVIALIPSGLAACSSDKDSGSESASASSSAASSTAASGSETATATSSAPGSDTATWPTPGAPESSPAPVPGSPGASVPAQPPAGAPAAQAPAPADRPAAVPAQGSDDQQIRAVVQGMGRADGTGEDYLNYITDNSCQAYVDRNGGLPALRQAAQAARTRPASEVAPEIDDISGISVQGDRATAAVTAHQRGGTPFSQNMEFAREGGAWRICPS